MIVLSFIAMYVLMYAMVNTFSNVFTSINQFYMAGLMTAPMLLIELLVMRAMYANKLVNMVLMVVGIVLLGLFFILIRKQTAVSDKQFLRSMIPHHAGAILMCEQASLKDAQVQALCHSIISGQQSEIDWMKAKLNTL
jgi:hypothetical protein